MILSFTPLDHLNYYACLVSLKPNVILPLSFITLRFEFDFYLVGEKLDVCGGLNENGLQSLRYVNAYSADSGTVLEGLGGVVLLE